MVEGVPEKHAARARSKRGGHRTNVDGEIAWRAVAAAKTKTTNKTRSPNRDAKWERDRERQGESKEARERTAFL